MTLASTRAELRGRHSLDSNEMNFQKSSVTCERVAVRRRIALAALHTEWDGLHSLSGAVGKVPGITEGAARPLCKNEELWRQCEDTSKLHGICVFIRVEVMQLRARNARVTKWGLLSSDLSLALKL